MRAEAAFAKREEDLRRIGGKRLENNFSNTEMVLVSSRIYARRRRPERSDRWWGGRSGFSSRERREATLTGKGLAVLGTQKLGKTGGLVESKNRQFFISTQRGGSALGEGKRALT